MKFAKPLLLGVAICLLLVGLSGSVRAQATDEVYIPETGHWIWGEFLTLYNSVDDPLLYFGYPITDDFTDPLTNQRVQYFQRARFDLVDTVHGPQVQIAPLGEWLHEGSAPLANIPNDGPTCRRFKTGYSVCYAFLQFYDRQNGLARFGEPVSAVEVLDGRYVQYFQYARMEWWPERAAGERVTLTDIGRLYFDKVVADPELLKSSPPANIAGKMLKPRVHVFVGKALARANDAQTVFVVVQDQYLRPMEGAQVGVTVVAPDATREFYRLPATNANGITQFTLTVGAYPEREIITLNAEATIRGETAHGSGWFRIWW